MFQLFYRRSKRAGGCIWQKSGAGQWSPCHSESPHLRMSAQCVSVSFAALDSSLVSLSLLLQVDLHFTAPERTGVFHYVVYLTSDSYLDLSFQKDLRVRYCPVGGGGVSRKSPID